MKHDHPSFSVVVRSYNEERHIGRLLSGIAAQTWQPNEVVLVDSGSTDATVSIAQRFDAKISHIQKSDFSFGRSLNQGCEAATGDFIVIVSAHCYPLYEDWFETLLAPFAEDDVGLTFGKQRGDERTKFSEHRVFKTWFPDEKKEESDSPFCNNANAAVRTSEWKANPYDEALTGLEDIAWAKELIAQGKRIEYVPEATVVHVHEETPAQTMNRYRREAIALKKIFPDSKFGVRDAVFFVNSNIVQDLWRATLDGQFVRHAKSILSFRVAQFVGTYRGHQDQETPNHRLRRRLYYPGKSAREMSRREHRRIDYENVEEKRP